MADRDAPEKGPAQPLPGQPPSGPEEPEPTNLDDEPGWFAEEDDAEVRPGTASTAGWGGKEPPPTKIEDEEEEAPETGEVPGPALPDERQLDPAERISQIDEEVLGEGELEPWLDEGDEAAPHGWEEFEERPPQAAPDDHTDWSDLENEARLLPPGLERVGRLERVRLEGLPVEPLLARMDTGASRSRIHGEPRPVGEGEVLLQVQGQELRLPRADDGEPGEAISVRVTLRLAGVSMPTVLSVHPPTDGEPLVLGCDLLAGRFVVDPAARDLHGID